MSYILDALRKADAERDRGNVPGIHAQPTFGDARSASGAPAKSRTAITIGIAFLAFAAALAIVVLAALGGWLPGFTTSRPATPAPTVLVPTPAPAPVPVAIEPARPAPVAPAVAPPVEAPKPRPEPAPVARKPHPAATTASAAAPPDAKPAATAERVYALAELPDEIRRQLPNLAVGGSMYSTKPADRVLIINGHVLHEGDTIAPGLVLHQIRLKAAVLGFRDHRFTIAF
jgi:general secretion pathway protein B